MAGDEDPNKDTDDKTPKDDSKKEEPKGLSQEEVNALIEKARKQEKDKLYGKIEELQGTVKSLADQAETARQAKESAEKAAKDKAEKERLTKLSVEDKIAETLDKLEEQLANERAERAKLDAKLDEAEKRRLEAEQEAKLEKYKAQVIRDAGEEIIPELVVGKTEDEIDRNVAKAKARYEELFTAVVDKAKGNRNPRLPGPTNPDEGELDAQSVNKLLTPQMIEDARMGRLNPDYEKNREQLFDQLDALYKRQAGR